MTMSKMALLGVAVVAAVVIGSGTLAWVHTATADHENAIHYVVGPDGRLIGAAPNPSIRSQWEREGLPN